MAGSPRRRRKDARPAPLELVELSELVAEWASPVQRGSGVSEAGDGKGPRVMARSQGSVRFEDTLGTSEDVQGMLGSLLIRAKVANKETEDFQRVVKSLRSEAKHLKA